MAITDTSRIPFLYPIKKDPQVLRLDYMLTRYKLSVAPAEVQRPIAWKAKERKAYFDSMCMGRTEGGFVFVNMEYAVQGMEDHGYSGDRANPYFKKLLSQGFNFLTLDGNNRWSFIVDLIEDRYSIPLGTYNMISEDTLHKFTVTKRNNVFSALGRLEQRTLLDRAFVITEYTQLDYAGLSEIFLNINNGVPLNPQEKRNAMDSDWSGYVRQLSLDLAPLLSLTLGDSYTKRLVGDDFIATSLAFAISCTHDEVRGIVQTTKDKLYASDFGTHFTDEYRKIFLELQDFVLDLVDDKTLPLDVKTITLPSFVQNLYWMLCNGLTEYDDVRDAAVLHSKARNNHSRVNEDGNNYVWACGGCGAKNNTFKMEVLTEILEQTSGYVPNNRTLSAVFDANFNTQDEEVEVEV
jgi:hypothetical protein